MSASLVGSEMCIRDSLPGSWPHLHGRGWLRPPSHPVLPGSPHRVPPVSYTHLDAADDMQCVDLG
eukprot:6651416-Alexandrium_andersonii.AAC.1